MPRIFCGDMEMIKLACFKVYSPQKMEPLPLHDKQSMEVFITNSEGKENTISSERRICSAISLLKILLILSLFTSLFFNLFFVISHVKQGSENKNICNKEEDVKEICLSCKHFEDNITYWRLKDRLTHRRGGGTSTDDKDVCCFEYNVAAHEMSKIMLLEHMTSDSFSANGTKRPAAHLTLNPAAIKDSDVQLQWNTGDDKTNRSFLKHVEYKDGQIVIEDAGTYYFYSFITFRSMQVQNETFLNHYVYRATEGERINKAEMIFMAKQMRQKGNLEYQTSLLAGIVNFESRDRVFTEVSDVSAVYRSSLTNYMGLFKL